MTFSEDSDDYGFFCDLESVKTMEYEEVVFYVVTTKTHYEVRRKHTTRPVVQGPPPTTVRKIAETKSSTENVKDLLRPKEAVIPQRRESQGETNTLKTPYKSENKIKTKPQNRVISFLKRLPRDIYYSLVVCCTTASCVYLFMSHPKMYDE
jgi:hypothetical protein